MFTTLVVTMYPITQSLCKVAQIHGFVATCRWEDSHHIVTVLSHHSYYMRKSVVYCCGKCVLCMQEMSKEFKNHTKSTAYRVSQFPTTLFSFKKIILILLTLSTFSWDLENRPIWSVSWSDGFVCVYKCPVLVDFSSAPVCHGIRCMWTF